MALIVTGNMVGAGILGLPVKTGLSGFWPSMVAIIVLWLCMYATAVILAEQPAFSSDGADLPALFGQELGQVGKWISVIANLIILYGLLTAYLAGAQSVLHALLPEVPNMVLMAGFFCCSTMLTLFGMCVLERGNMLFMVLMWGTFIALIVLTGEQVKPEQLTYTDWGFLPSALPIVIAAFHFHNLIPTLCHNMMHDKKRIRLAMLIGTSVGFVMNTAWALVVCGSLPLDKGANSLFQAFTNNLPATVPLEAMISSPWFTTCASLFALTAITTSYMTNGTALFAFMSDLTAPVLKRKKTLVNLLVYLPPVLVAASNPNLFLSALDLVAGVGICLIFGVLPAFLLIKYNTGTKRMLGYVLLLIFGFILCCEVAQETGLLELRPAIEYWVGSGAGA